MSLNFFNYLNILEEISVFLCLGTAFIITYLSVPSIVWVSNNKGLTAIPNSRTSHNDLVPNLGGVGVFAGLILAMVLFTGNDAVVELKYIIAGLLVLFFIGVKDDVQNLDYRKKIIAQLLAIGLVVILGDIRITNFHGFLGIYEISYNISVLFTFFIFLVTINSYNLIDGIDGLASGIAMLTSLVFGIWFMISGFKSYALMCFSLIGALLAFFRFNVFSKKYKLFLGDTGSLIIGFMIAIFIIRFLEYELIAEAGYTLRSSPAIAFGILIIPMFDTLRVFTLRTRAGKSPFIADRNHIHHRLLDIGLTHLQTTIILLFINILFIAMVFFLQDIGNILLVILTLFLAIFLNFIAGLILQKKQKEFNINYKQWRDRMYLRAIDMELS